ncbi:hypothetical protein [Sporolactobacillus sp. KGMB 08714]|uniref:hypothetical protein n=1 Tax=Sporolactobacillus sp. KGMB 08714 TaxID=3064704 RepID=UPI002FBD5A7D
MNDNFYDPYRPNQNPNFTNPTGAPMPMNMYPNLNVNPVNPVNPNPGINTNPSMSTKNLKEKVMSALRPLMPSMHKTMAIAYLMGMGYTYNHAKRTVESWSSAKMPSRETY